MKKLCDLNLALWFLRKNDALSAAACNVDYEYEVIKETEKAVQLHIVSTKWNKLQAAQKNWNVWVPKSAIEC